MWLCLIIKIALFIFRKKSGGVLPLNLDTAASEILDELKLTSAAPNMLDARVSSDESAVPAPCPTVPGVHICGICKLEHSSSGSASTAAGPDGTTTATATSPNGTAIVSPDANTITSPDGTPAATAASPDGSTTDDYELIQLDTHQCDICNSPHMPSFEAIMVSSQLVQDKGPRESVSFSFLNINHNDDK